MAPASPAVILERLEDGAIAEVTVIRDGRTLRMLGSGGAERELAFARSFAETLPLGALPVLLGSGAGHALRYLAEFSAVRNLPLLVVDKEAYILAATGLQGQSSPHIHWITQDSPFPEKALTQWQEAHGGLPLAPCPHPFYSRLDKDFYGSFRSMCEASRQFNFWEKVRYPRFQGNTARILIMTCKYFLTGEIIAACTRLGIEHRLLEVPDGEYGQGEFVEDLLEAVVSFKPDFVFTINHLGVDREGVLVNLLEKLRLPLASWFVDNPHLILALYSQLVSPWTAIFTWDTDNIASLEDMGFAHVRYLPLGCDTVRFAPPAPAYKCRPEWQARVSFVGNSMVHKVRSRLDRTRIPPLLESTLEETATGFGASDERSIPVWLEANRPDLFSLYASITVPSERLDYEAAITWEATRQYRLSCIAAIFPHQPLLVGDSGWNQIVPKQITWRYHSEISYYSDLPLFYPCSEINFNCTSKQMKGAVNQRVFDVPATGAFILTDYREQVENLFEPGREIACYHSPDEAAALVEHYLAAPAEREAIARAARRRVLQEHTYEQRVLSLINTMHTLYS